MHHSRATHTAKNVMDDHGFGDSQAIHCCALDLFRTMQIEHSHSDVADGGARPAAAQLNPETGGDGNGAEGAGGRAEGADDREEHDRDGDVRDGPFGRGASQTVHLTAKSGLRS